MPDSEEEIPMPWGKYKGTFVHALPSSYLRLRTVIWIRKYVMLLMKSGNGENATMSTGRIKMRPKTDVFEKASFEKFKKLVRHNRELIKITKDLLSALQDTHLELTGRLYYHGQEGDEIDIERRKAEVQ